MRVEQLFHFIEVAHQSSISKASKNLFISQPSLSTSITNLEEELGVKLFYRLSKGVELTSHGKEVLPLTQEIIQNLEEIRFLTSRDRALSGIVNLSAIPSSCSCVLLDLIIQLKRHYPDLTVKINESRPYQVLSHLHQREAQLGISAYFSYEKDSFLQMVQDKRLKTETLYTDKLCIFVGKNHPLANQGTATITQLHHYPFVTFDADLVHKQKIPSTNFDGLTANLPEPTYRLKDRESIKKIVAENLAITLLPESMMINDLYRNEGFIIPIEVSDMDLSIQTVLVYMQDKILSLEEQKIIELLKPLCAKYSI